MENKNQSFEVKDSNTNFKKGSIWNWVFGVIFIIIGIADFGSSVLFGIIFLAVGLIWLPPIADIIKNKYNYSLSKKVKIILIVLMLIVFGVTQSSNVKTNSLSTPTETEQPAVGQPQTFEDRIKALAVKTGVTDISYEGIDDEKADNNRPAGSRMITVKLNVASFYNANSFYKNTGELTGKIFQETFASNPNVYDVIVWYSGETTDKYGNKSKSVILSYSIDKKTYQKINWQNFDSTKLCDFLKSEGSINGGDAACNTLANIK